jgi:ABC-2 type transport system permease protein
VNGRVLRDLYAHRISVTVRTETQHRFSLVMMLLTFLAEPLVYLAVWGAVARQNGGTVGTMTEGSIAAYFIVWTLVRVVNVVYSPAGFEGRIRRGEFTGQLLRPAHPIHYDLAWFIGLKVPAVVLWLPVGALLVVLFQPTLAPSPLGVVAFLPALCGAYLVRSLYLWTLGLVTFWTTRTAALFEFVMLVELLMSGRLVPMSLMPQWMQDLSLLLPFYWAFGFPIETMIGSPGVAKLTGGLLMQALWTVVGFLVMNVVWRRAIRRYDAVGG